MSFAGISSTGSTWSTRPVADGAAEYRVVFGGFQRLGHGHAAVFLDRPQTERAVRAGAREHDADSVFAAVFGQGAEETVDRRALAARLGGRRQRAACRS